MPLIEGLSDLADGQDEVVSTVDNQGVQLRWPRLVHAPLPAASRASTRSARLCQCTGAAPRSRRSQTRRVPARNHTTSGCILFNNHRASPMSTTSSRHLCTLNSSAGTPLYLRLQVKQNQRAVSKASGLRRGGSAAHVRDLVRGHGVVGAERWGTSVTTLTLQHIAENIITRKHIGNALLQVIVSGASQNT
jgi:hypothetical protein